MERVPDLRSGFSLELSLVAWEDLEVREMEESRREEGFRPLPELEWELLG